jgi:histidine ammonia-lyase
MSATLAIDGNSLTIAQVLSVARGKTRVTLSPRARKAMQRSRAWVEKAVRDRVVVYGVTTGFGAFQNVSIPADELRELRGT